MVEALSEEGHPGHDRQRDEADEHRVLRSSRATVAGTTVSETCEPSLEQRKDPPAAPSGHGARLRQLLKLLTWLPSRPNQLFRLSPKNVTPMMISSAMNATRIAYSVAVAPRSFFTNSSTRVCIATTS